MIYLFIISYILFGFIAFRVAMPVAYDTKHITIKIFFVSLINGYSYFFYTMYVSFEYEYITIIYFFLLYLIEIKLIFNKNWMVTLFQAISAVVNIFAIRMFVLASFAIHNNIMISEYGIVQEHRLLVTITAFTLTAIYFSFLLQIFQITKVENVLQDSDNFRFSLYLLLSAFVYFSFTVFIIYTSPVEDIKMLYLAIKIAICVILGYALSIYYNFLFSRLRMHKFKFYDLVNALREEEKHVEQLEKEVVTDTFTGLKVREVAYHRIEHFLHDQEPFFIIFIDMNGLKIVNDTYGHEEGDVYIHAVVEIIKEHYPTETIARLGGDEFLIIGKIPQHDNLSATILQVVHNIKEFSSLHAKPYETSISYGIVVVDEQYKNESAESLIKQADIKMYDYKRKNKKERTVIRLQ